MSCSSSEVAQIRQGVMVGMKKAEVERQLVALGIKFEIISKEQFSGRLSGQDIDAEKYASNILAGIQIPKTPLRLVEKLELVTIGFDANDAVIEVSCRVIFTGP